MADFAVVTSRLLTGAAINSADDIAQLQKAGVTHVVDARAEFDDGPLLAGAFTYLYNGTQDDGQTKPPDWFKKTLDFVLPILAQPHTKCLLHCAAGINRGPSSCFAVMLALGWSPEETEAKIRAVRPQVGLRYKADAITAVTALGYV